jgi:hypothetical protein
MSRSIRDAVKEHQMALQEAPAAKPAQTPPKTPHMAPKAAVDGTEWIPATCGHTVKLERLVGAKLEQLDKKRKKIMERACGPCRAAEHNKKQEEAKAARPPKKWQNQGRLPHGSVMHAEYDGEKQRWTGGLMIVAKDGSMEQVFEATMSGLFPLYRNLDLQYRAWEARQKGGADGKDLTCEDCGLEQSANAMITKGDHHGGTKTVCRNRYACHRRSPG